MTLTTEQRSILELADKSGQPPCGADMPTVPGFHFCPDWDFMPICDGTLEAETCTCEVEAKP